MQKHQCYIADLIGTTLLFCKYCFISLVLQVMQIRLKYRDLILLVIALNYDNGFNSMLTLKIEKQNTPSSKEVLTTFSL